MNTLGTIGTCVPLPDGTLFDLSDPDYSLFTIPVIAQILSKICRYGGRSPRFYSVAEHSALAAEYCQVVLDGRYAREVLLHDAADAILVEMPTPAKKLLPDYRELEARFAADMTEHLQLRPEADSVVEHCDKAMLKFEMMRFYPAVVDDHLPLLKLYSTSNTRMILRCADPDTAEKMFLDRWESICADDRA